VDVLSNTLDAPLVDRVQALCARATDISVASAFITADLVLATLVPAARRGARVRVLTVPTATSTAEPSFG